MLLKMSMVRKRLSGDCRFVHEMRCWRALTEVFTKCELAVLKFHCRGRVAGYSSKWLDCTSANTLQLQREGAGNLI